MYPLHQYLRKLKSDEDVKHKLLYPLRFGRQHGVSVQLFLRLCKRQQASVQAAKVVSTLNFNSAIYNYDARALCYIMMPGALCTTVITITLSISPTSVNTGCPS
jgi:hypothetical protein